jgi:hypothetical protein
MSTLNSPHTEMVIVSSDPSARQPMIASYLNRKVGLDFPTSPMDASNAGTITPNQVLLQRKQLTSPKMNSVSPTPSENVCALFE